VPPLRIGVSYAFGWNRVGAVVMVLLDPADVPLHIAKQFKYVGDARGGWLQKVCQTAADVFFVIFMLLFAVMRLGLYPYVVGLFCLNTHTNIPPIPLKLRYSAPPAPVRKYPC
jgi:hypothetical protein